MNVNTTCPCCSGSMLRHLSNHHSYWFCPHCRQKMPNLAIKNANLIFDSSLINVAIASKK
jgi:ribosomal protein L37AE/L43A